jgi:uncharacterized protein (DUF2062 family)
VEESDRPAPVPRRAMRRRPAGMAASFSRLVRFRLIIPVLRSPHSPEYTARGVAIGVFWGLTPTLGLQTMEIVLTWFVSRRVLGRDASLLQAMIWVWVNNPLTMVPLFYLFYLTGLLLAGGLSGAAGYDAFAALWNAKDGVSGLLDRTIALARALGWPTLIGSLPWAALGAWVSYRWALRVVTRRRRRLTRTREAQDS